jgi:hypothetical protein
VIDRLILGNPCENSERAIMIRLGFFCFALAALVACGTNDPQPASWKLVDPNETAALLAVWGVDANDVWVVGGRPTIDAGPTLLHFKAGAWTRVDSGQTGIDLWWVFGLSADDVYFGGSSGTILHYHGGTFDKMTTPGTGVVFGIWGTADDDLWAVGQGTPTGIVWHYDGTQWSAPALPAGVGSHVFKVHGQATDDVWMSCDDGTALHWQGTSLERGPTGVAAPLFSIVTTPDGAIAVGGTNGQGQIAEYAGAWSVAPIASAAQWRGAAVRDTTVYAVGEYGTVAKREQGVWQTVTQTVTQNNFHAAWIDPDGGVWGAGGQFDSTPLTTDGFLTYFGSQSISEVR